MQGIHFQRVQAILRVPITPDQLGSIPDAIYKYLNDLVGTYHKVFRGLVVCYTESLGILDSVGSILGTDAKIYVKVSAEFVVMKIAVRGKVTVKIDDVLEGSVSGLVCGVLPAEISGHAGYSGEWAGEIQRVNLFPLFITVGESTE
ncbi:uncharacterized protein NEMAJ01_0787 [Nematocida major]|uniref:uncharacterized protein n=1 Tax=Nematocida major TaxID=1912982 RepID=UPI0020080D1A|nr:uncharacterized protein NEMAJ01_0787 [Nematocida major]KAH9385891.1 hypothetical protein NEMAJ01_0787 [Nematocida major]